MKSQIWISGIGIVSPIGSNVNEFSEALLNGKDGFKQITDFNTRKGKERAALVTEYNPDDQHRLIKMMRRAVKEAIFDAALPNNVLHNSALVMATMAGDSKQAEHIWGKLNRNKVVNEREKMSSLIKYPMTSLLDAVAATFKIRGSRTVVSNACASGNIAIGYGLNLLEMGKVDAVIVCGAEVLKETMYWGMCGLRILAGELKAFDKNRKGTVLGEGVGVLVLERAENIVARKGKVWGELAGYGNHCDPQSDAIIPDKDGEGLVAAMNKAMLSESIKPKDINYLNAYGTGTLISDLTEIRAVKKLFSNYAEKLPISSSKTFLGNSGGASGVLEAIVTLVAMKNGFIPPTLNWEKGDADLNLDYVPRIGRKGQITYALSNSIGGGGVNTSILLKSINLQSAENERKISRINSHTLIENDTNINISEEIVITGVGVLSILGNSLEDLSYNIQKLNDHEASEMNRYCVKESLNKLEEQFRRANPAAGYLLMAAREAVNTSRLSELKSDEKGVVIGTEFGGYTSTAKELCETILNLGPNFITPYVVTNNGQNLGATLLSQFYGISGYNVTLTSGSVAGLDALIHAANVLKNNEKLKAILVGGVDIHDIPLDETYRYIQEKLGIGVPLGEGSAVFILEKKTSALKRRIKILGTITEYMQGSLAYGRGNSKIDEASLNTCLESILVKENRPKRLFYHIPAISFAKNSINNVEQYFKLNFEQVMNLTDFFGEAHSATGMLGLAAIISEDTNMDCEQKSTEMSGLFTVALGGNYRYLELRQS